MREGDDGQQAGDGEGVGDVAGGDARQGVGEAREERRGRGPRSAATFTEGGTADRTERSRSSGRWLDRAARCSVQRRPRAPSGLPRDQLARDLRLGHARAASPRAFRKALLVRRGPGIEETCAIDGSPRRVRPTVELPTQCSNDARRRHARIVHVRAHNASDWPVVRDAARDRGRLPAGRWPRTSSRELLDERNESATHDSSMQPSGTACRTEVPGQFQVVARHLASVEPELIDVLGTRRDRRRPPSPVGARSDGQSRSMMRSLAVSLRAQSWPDRLRPVATSDWKHGGRSAPSVRRRADRLREPSRDEPSTSRLLVRSDAPRSRMVVAAEVWRDDPQRAEAEGTLKRRIYRAALARRVRVRARV